MTGYLPSGIRRQGAGLGRPAPLSTSLNHLAELRDALGVSRKYARAILEYLDATGTTRREGDVHVPVRPSKLA